MESFQFRPYSLRRGGATFWFAKHGSFDRLLVQGRWQAPRTARIYINSGLTALAEATVPASKLRGFQTIYKRALKHELPILERTRKWSSSAGRGMKVAKAFVLRKIGLVNPQYRCLRLFFFPAWRKGEEGHLVGLGAGNCSWLGGEFQGGLRLRDCSRGIFDFFL